jgi:hypothetical protein
MRAGKENGRQKKIVIPANAGIHPAALGLIGLQGCEMA